MATMTIDANGNIVDPASFTASFTSTRKQPKTKKERQDIISLKQFNKEIPDEEAAIAFVEKKIWGDTPFCGRCGADNVYRVRSGKPMSHRCRDCNMYFSVRIGTVMTDTNLPLKTWLLAIHLIHTSRKGISAMQLHKTLGVTYKTAWFLGHRIREAMQADRSLFRGGVVEVDETYVGGKWNRMHAHKRKQLGHPMANKMTVMGFKDRETGRVVAFPINESTGTALQDEVMSHVYPGTTVHTDGHGGYSRLNSFGYYHEWINHKIGEYVRDQITTNGIESFWSLLKRGYVGVFHYMSWRHLHRYVNEFAFRQSVGPGNGFETMGEVLYGMRKRRLTYARLTGRRIGV